MDLQTCYSQMGGNYEEVKRRLNKDDRIARFLKLFLKDDNYQLLHSAIDAQDWETAFRAAHSLKGISMNLSITSLIHSSSAITEALRGNTPREDLAALLAAVDQDYQAAEAAILALDGSGA